MWGSNISILTFTLCLILDFGWADENSQHFNLPGSCYQVMSNSSNKVGVYLLHLPSGDLPPFRAYCTLDGFTIIQRRQSGKENFYRNWQDYKNGFGDVYDDYWLGLDRIHAITKDQPITLEIMLKNFDGAVQYMYYNLFQVANETDDYRLTIDDYVGDDDGNALHYANRMRFSTYDRNNCNGPYHFAHEAQSGFWFTPTWNQYNSNLNGPYHQYADRESIPRLFWDFNTDLESAHMAVRSRNEL